MLPSLVVVGAGVVLLAVLVVAVRRPIMRFTRARAALQERVTLDAATLRELWEARRSGAR